MKVRDNMRFSEFRYVKIPFTLYDLFGYLLPGIFFFALFPITYDAGAVLNVAVQYIRNQTVADGASNQFFLLHFVDMVHESPWLIATYFILVAYLLGHVIAALSGFFLERIGVEKFLKYPAANMFGLRTHEGSIEKNTFKILKKIPWWDTIKQFIFRNYRRQYSDGFITAFNYKFAKRFSVEPNNPSDVFWLCFTFTSQNCPATFQRSSHFLNLYGFARNLSMMFFIFSATIVGFEWSKGLPVNWWVAVGYAFLGIGFFWEYLKFFRRLNDEVYRGFMCYVATMDDDAEDFGPSTEE